ncbi:UDP-3-O-acyl-N-acetylglucosamine deacetylase [Desulfofalx alkaliphila]|uniref:UDP-3-O-acyl-N-acetylglucosamine deacetylase n=1 Tax=Desulfofalx alkaliphila TaxID=105483 RepID=UPI0006907F21|nr:UDP-3-O-acyl-N-acetylglucosamine deacetylase [Desulfofalx alkaliphila]
MQTTLKKPVCCEGIDITGTTWASVTLKPAPPDHGIVFYRDDLPASPPVHCNARNATVDSRWTSLEEKGVRVEHTEHLLAAIGGLGIDNLEVRMNCASIPVVDGYSCSDFVRSILKAGLRKQRGSERCIEIKGRYLLQGQFSYNGKNYDRYLAVLPAKHLELTYILDYPDRSLPTQLAHSIITPEVFTEELANARSFISEREYREVSAMIGKGTESLLVFSARDGGLGSLRWPNEPARHKLVDLLGDLRVAGQRIKGKFIAFRSGHQLNIEMVKEIIKNEGGNI